MSDYDEIGHVDTNNSQIIEAHTPVCDDALKPHVGRSFDDFDNAVAFYKLYGEACGFDIRRGIVTRFRDGFVARMLVYCNQQGEKNAIPDDINQNITKPKRRRASNRVGCMARIIFIFDPVQCCVVERFEEVHNHQLVSDEFKKYLKINRNLGHIHKNFLMNCARANIGATKAYRLYKEFVGGYSEVGSTQTDWKNYARDLRAYIKGCDAQIILEKLILKKQTCGSFFFEYTVDKDDKLNCIFWADPTARRNYSAFGDVVSFDCTYSTNRYNMIFAPFTGKDNHGRIVTFAAALLSCEDNIMYSWVFQKFKECMGRSPSMIIADQDPAMKIALQRIFPESKHRLCMWHIMTKVSDKVLVNLRKDEDFRKRLNAIVWSEVLSVTEFEQQWNELMIEFGLTENVWFCSLYDIRRYWIPAYFRDIHMSGICRTTSISESVNSFFDNYLSKGSNLVEFFMHFDSAMDAQRQNNDILNNADSTLVPFLKTTLQFEKHAASIYTTHQFIKLQAEIVESCFVCSISSTKESDENTVFYVDDGSEAKYTVDYSKLDNTIVCSCNKFVRDGILCSHIFSTFKLLKWVSIPEKYIVHRWTKAPYKRPMNEIGVLDLEGSADLVENRRMINNMISDFYACIGAVDGDKPKMHILRDGLSDLRDVLVKGDVESSNTTRKRNLFDLFYGTPKPDEVKVLHPILVKTKGSGSRLKSRKEAAIERAKKPLRLCKKCNTLGHHDSRNCPTC